MSHINEKLGLRPAGRRSMMKLPADKALRNRITAAQCPACGLRHATLSKTTDGWLWCGACSHRWEMEPEGNDGTA